MNADEFTFAPPARLAIAYARADLRAAFSLLLRFDERIAGIVGRSTEPLIAQMKIAWWNEALSRPVGDRPKGEPLLVELEAIDGDRVVPAMQMLLDAWATLLVEDQWSTDTLNAFAQARGEAIFGSYSRWVSNNADLTDLGSQWAVDDLRLRFGSRVQSLTAASVRLPSTRSLRPLTILALAATAPTGFQMTWHALTGR